MSISSINLNSTNNLSDLLGISQTSSINTQASGQVQSSQSLTSGSTDSVHFSKPAKMLSELQRLQQSDPTKFKTVMTNIANQLQSAAKNAQGDESQMLTNMANKFQSAAQSGDISGLMPGVPQGMQGKHHHHGAQSSSQTSFAQNSQPQTNNSIKSVMDNIFTTVDQAVSSLGQTTSTQKS